jgi:acyl transferase domain-containing protein
VLRGEDDAWLARMDILQPALFAVMVSLADLWRACGVRPAAVLGHSQGEIAAAYVAGALSLEDAARVVALRAQAITRIAGQGGMLWVSAPVERLRPLLDPLEGRASLAAINGPASLVVSGEHGALAELAASCAENALQTRTVAVDCAGHSVQIDALEDELLEAFAPVTPRAGEIPFYSAVTGARLDGTELGPVYWYRNLRQTVLFEPALRALLERGSRAFVEVAPHPVLALGVEETIAEVLDYAPAAAVFGALRRDEGGPARFALSLAEAHANGVALDWETILAGAGQRPVSLPTYPFQRQRFWLETAGAGTGPLVSEQQGPPPSQEEVVAEAELAAELAAAPAEERRQIALEAVLAHVASVLGHASPAEVEPDRPFQELGFDSVTAVELRNRLGAASALRLPPALAFDYPTPIALAGYLAEQCAPDGAAATPEAALEAALASLDEALAAVGEAGGARERVGMRLRSALADFSGVPGERADVGVEELAAMSHDEVFALIDEEAGDER